MQRLNYKKTKENILLVIFILIYVLLFSGFKIFSTNVNMLLNGFAEEKSSSYSEEEYEQHTEDEECAICQGKYEEKNLVSVLNGIGSQLEVLVCVYMVINFKRKGLMTANILSVCNAITVSIKVVVTDELSASPGIITPLCTILTVNVLYRYVHATELLLSLDMNTEVYNRNQYLNDLTRFSSRKMRSVGCAFVDVNGLHDHNNNYGHDSGDKLLKTVASRLRQIFPKASIYRIGGDEFTIIFPNCRKRELSDGLAEVKESLCNDHIYVAVGMEWRRKNINIDDMFKAADAMMYDDKNNFYKEHPELSQRHSNKENENKAAEALEEN
ncbi:MAG: GGDEF domain-containing protein [Ruminococcus sp.]|nr:GGDEF domain-containing protein [Ruminococcus sp.]MBR6669775.1 GGDEF domain-containing protein [Ruminococcus sp.]